MEKQKSKPEHMLMTAIGFTEEDLEANREGYITKRQRSQLGMKRNGWILRTFLAAALSIFLCAWAIADGTRIGDTVSSRVAIITLIGVVAGVVIIGTWLKGANFTVDMRQGEINALEGRVMLDVAGQGNSGNPYAVRIEDITFAINKRIFLAFKNGDPYRIYYAPHSKTILSAEWLREE